MVCKKKKKVRGNVRKSVSRSSKSSKRSVSGKSTKVSKKKSTKRSTKRPTKKVSQKATKKTTKRSTKKSTKVSKKKSTKRSTKRPTKKVSQKATKKTAKKKTTKKTTKRPTKKSTKVSKKKSTKRSLVSKRSKVSPKPKSKTSRSKVAKSKPGIKVGRVAGKLSKKTSKQSLGTSSDSKSLEKQAVTKKIDKSEILARLKEIRNVFSSIYARQLLVLVGGENAFAVLSSLSKQSTDEELSKGLKLKISDVRSALNKLHNVSIVNYDRTKDEETGWYTYRWYVEMEKMTLWVKDHIDKATHLGSSGDMFYCPKCGIEATYTFEESVEVEFSCPICKKPLKPLDNKVVKKVMNTEPERLIRVIQRYKRI